MEINVIMNRPTHLNILNSSLYPLACSFLGIVYILGNQVFIRMLLNEEEIRKEA